MLANLSNCNPTAWANWGASYFNDIWLLVLGAVTPPVDISNLISTLVDLWFCVPIPFTVILSCFKLNCVLKTFCFIAVSEFTLLTAALNISNKLPQLAELLRNCALGCGNPTDTDILSVILLTF